MKEQFEPTGGEEAVEYVFDIDQITEELLKLQEAAAGALPEGAGDESDVIGEYSDVRDTQGYTSDGMLDDVPGGHLLAPEDDMSVLPPERESDYDPEGFGVTGPTLAQETMGEPPEEPEIIHHQFGHEPDPAMGRTDWGRETEAQTQKRIADFYQKQTEEAQTAQGAIGTGPEDNGATFGTIGDNPAGTKKKRSGISLGVDVAGLLDGLGD